MNCLEFERRLDDDALAALEPEARAHAAACTRCAAALAFAGRIETELARHYGAAEMPAPPATLAAGVMARISAFESPARTVVAAPPVARRAWWSPDPVLVGAVATAALLVWRGEVLWRMAQAWSRALEPTPPAVVQDLVRGAGPLLTGMRWAGAATPEWVGLVTAALLLVPALAWGARALARTVERAMDDGPIRH